MGFTTGFLGGVTLTYSLLYGALHLHRSNRNIQHTILAQQSMLLNSVVEPLPPQVEEPPYEVRKTSLVETLKDRWNREIEVAVRQVQNTDWNEVRERWERRIGNVWSTIRESDAGKEVETKFKEKFVETAEEVKEATKSTTDGPRLLELK